MLKGGVCPILLGAALMAGTASLAAPGDVGCIPEPPIAPPDGAKGLAFDNHGNYWTLVAGVLHVLPAQDQSTWARDELSSVPSGRWQSIAADESGHIWLSDGKRTCRMDPHRPSEGWFEDAAGPDASRTTGLRHWRLVARMPSGTHDLSGDVLDGKFFMDWSITGDFGYPSTGRFHSKLLEFDPALARWRIAADYGRPRGFCAVGVLAGRIWTVAGSSLDPAGERYHPVLTQVCDPATGAINRGPDLPVALPCAVGLSTGQRLYVLGFPAGRDEALKLFSIGGGEETWTAEPDGPVGGGSSFGTELDGKLYTVVPHMYIAVFDTETGAWETTEAPHAPRSPAISHYRGEVWVMGGRTSEGGEVTYIYNPETRRWRKDPGLPCELVWGCAFNINGSLYLTGGAGGAPYSFSNRTFKLREESS